MFDTAKEWAQRLLVKYGIMQPMAPEEPEMCSPVPPIPSHVTATYPAFFDNVVKKDAKPKVGYPASLATRDDAYERLKRREEDEAAARRRREAEADSGLMTAAMLYVASPALFDMGRTSSPEPVPSPSYEPARCEPSSYDSGSSSYSSGGCE